jgi:hypothetical protein
MMAEALPHGIAVAPLSATGHIWPAGGDGSAILAHRQI